MAYLPNIPTATDQLNISQGNIQGNFQFLLPITNGVLTFVSQIAPPALSGTDIFQFARTSTSTSTTEMCIEKTSGSIVEFTAGNVAGSGGWSRFPSNLMVVWRTVTSTSFPYSFTYSSIAGFPGFDPADPSVPTTFVTLFGTSTYAAIVSPTSTALTLVINAGTFTGGPVASGGLCWISVGRGPVI